MADSVGNDNEDAVSAIADYPTLKYLNTPLTRRKSFANAAGAGMSVLEYRPKGEKANAELAALMGAIF